MECSGTLHTVAEEPSCEDTATLLDHSSTKYADGNCSIVSKNKAIKKNYSTKFMCKKFVGEVFQPSKSLSSSSVGKSKKRKQVKPFESLSIKYV